MQRSAAVARRVEQVGGRRGAVLPLCCCALLATLADATMAEGRAGLGRGELSGGQAGLSICLCLYFYTRCNPNSQRPRLMSLMLL